MTTTNTAITSDATQAAKPTKPRLSYTTKCTRDEYGAVDTASNGMLDTAKKLLVRAIKANLLEASYSNFYEHRRWGWLGDSLNYAYYDINKSCVLVQRRYTERTKYGTSVQKDYFFITKNGRAVVVKEAPKHRVMKLAKASKALGDVIATLTGTAKKPVKQKSPFSDKVIAYKIVEQRADGKLFSVFDSKFEWALGKAKIEAASSDHSSGYYVFDTIANAKEALERNVVFNKAWQAGKRLVLIECESAGRREEYDNKKICVTYCRPTRVLEELTAAPMPLAA